MIRSDSARVRVAPKPGAELFGSGPAPPKFGRERKGASIGFGGGCGGSISSDDPTVQLAVEAPEGRSSGKPTCQQSRDTEFCQPTGGHWEPRYGMVFPHAVVICDAVFVWSCSRLLACNTFGKLSSKQTEKQPYDDCDDLPLWQPSERI